jgi:hypothetical protein
VRFIIDEDVPKSAADFLVDRGHDVDYVVDALLPGSEDHLVCKWAHEHAAAVVTCNVRHFSGLLKREGYARAGLLGLPQPLARERLEEFIHLVETEGALFEDEGRLWLLIRDTTVLIGR